MKFTVDLKRQVAIKAWIVAILGLGFVVSISIPRLAIVRLGETGYGVYALIVGFSGVLAFADLGLVPGLIRGLAGPIANGNHAELHSKLRTIDCITFAAITVLVTGCALLMYSSLPIFNWNALHALLVFAAGTLVYIRADIRASLVEVSGAVVVSYMLRGLYLVVYLSSIVSLYYCFRLWKGVWVLCYAQLFASWIYYVAVKFFIRGKLGTQSGSCRPMVGAKTKFWAEAWRVSTPERLNRVIQLVMAAIERPLLIATAGLVMVTSYDLLMRLVLLVSAVPGALNDPLLAMLAHDSVRPDADRKFPLALRLTKIASVACASFGFLLCMLLWAGFHEKLFGVSSRIPLAVGVLVALVAAINIQTAPESAALTAEGVVWPMNAKLYTEAAGILVGGLVAWWLRNGLLFIVIRYCALGVSATGFLLLAAKLGRRTSGQPKEACCVGD